MAGDTITLVVDTLDPATAFDPVLTVIGPDRCEPVTDDDTLPCTAPPPAFACPSLRIDAPDDGTYTLLVENLGSCADPAIGSYRLLSGAQLPTLVANDAPTWSTATLTGTLAVE